MNNDSTPKARGGSMPIALCLAIVVVMIESVVFVHTIRSSFNLRDDPLARLIALEVILSAVLVVVLTTRVRTRIAAGAGIAFATAVFGGLGFAFLIGLSGIGTGAVKPALSHALRPFLAANVALAFAACWTAGRSLKGFALGAAAIVIVGPISYYGVAAAVLLAFDVGAREGPSGFPTAQRAMVSLTGCLMRSRIESGDRTFPRALDATLAGGCNAALLRRGAIPDYTISYEPRPDHTGRIVDFRLLAMPRRQRIEGAEPLMSDSQGVVFANAFWSSAGYERVRSDIANGRLSVSGIPGLIDFLRYYVRRHDPARAPTSIDEVLNDSLLSAGSDLEKTLREGVPYRLAYLPPAPTDPVAYAVSSTCTRYAEACIRSYFRDYAGQVHVTADPRSATADDPIIPSAAYDGAILPSDADWPSS